MPEPRTVLYATHSGDLSGGIRQLVNNALAMRDLGLTALIAAPESPALRAAAPGVEFVPFEDFRRPLRAARFLARLVRERGIDVVHAFHGKAVKAAVLARLADRAGAGRFRLYLNRGVIFTPNTAIGAMALAADGVVCNSAECLRVLHRHLVPMRRLNLVYNSFLGLEDRERAVPDAQAGPPRVVYVGNDSGFKGLDVFLAAAVRCLATPGAPAAEFHVCGSAWRDDLLALPIGPDLARFRDRFRFHGRIPHAEVLRVLSGAAAYLLTSRQESMPNTLVEAFAAGLPAVCTAVGGVVDIVRDGFNGLLCPSEDAACLAARLAALLADPDLRAAMSRRNRDLVESFFGNARKGRSLLRMYSGERVVESVPLG